LILPIEIIVGGGGSINPAAGTTDCIIPTIRGMVFYIEKIGYGTYDRTKYQALSNGGFRLLGGDTFQPGERFVVHLSGLSYGTDATSYTNGFNLSQTMAALFGRVGWRQPLQSGSPVVNSTNLLSKSGRYYQDFHALVSVANIKSILEEPGASDTNLNSYMESLQRSIIMRCLTSVFYEPEYLSQGLLFDRRGENDQVITNGNLFVGYRIKTPPIPDIAVQVDSVSLYFDSDATFNLYLFQDNRKTPVWFTEVSTVGNQQTIVNLPDIVLNYIGGANAGNSFYLGYFQADIGSAKAYDEQKRKWFEYCFGVQPIESPKLSGEYDFNRLPSYSSRTYGMNLHVSAFRDHTWQIVKKAALFDNMIGLQMAAQTIEQLIYTTRSNSTERALKDGVATGMAYMDLNSAMPISDGPKIQGLQKKIEEEKNRLRQSFYPKPKPQSMSVC
jgi:hypothetical protein